MTRIHRLSMMRQYIPVGESSGKAHSYVVYTYRREAKRDQQRVYNSYYCATAGTSGFFPPLAQNHDVTDWATNCPMLSDHSYGDLC
jgi:hypothetical protein